MIPRKVKNLSQSFFYAFRGVRACMQLERNFRIHLCVMLYVMLFAYLAKLEAISYALLCLCFGMMLGSELINTAIERLCDKDACGYNSMVRDAKDLAAGAVLVCALFCVGVAICLFGNAQAIGRIIACLQSRLWLTGLFLLSIPASIAFIFDLGGKA